MRKYTREKAASRYWHWKDMGMGIPLIFLGEKEEARELNNPD